MKTSNKILLALGIIVIVLMVIFLVALRASFKAIENNQIDGNGNLQTDVHEVTAFRVLDIDGDFDVTLSIGAPSLSIETDENLIAHVISNVEDNTLKIKTGPLFRKATQLRLTISADTLEGISLSKSATLRCRDTLRFEELSIGIGGDGSAEVHAETQRLYLGIGGAGMIRASGNTGYLMVEGGGPFIVDASEVESKEVEVSVSGPGSVFVHATELLRVGISGPTSVQYRGTPEIQKQIFGGGSLSQMAGKEIVE